MKIKFFNQTTSLFILLAVLWYSCNNKKEQKEKPNIVFILADDLGYGDLSSYGATKVSTPNIDRLGRMGTVFSHAYCQQAICGPTRNSFLSGRRPQRTKSWNFRDDFRLVGPDWVSLPQYFKQHSYTTLGTG